MNIIMRKLAIIMLIVSISFGQVCPAEAANSVNKQIGKAYARILKRYLEVCTALKKNYRYSDISLSTDDNLVRDFYCEGLAVDNAVQEFMDAFSKSADIRYRIIDFNKDGTPELFVADTEGMLYNVFTFKKGKAIYLMGSVGGAIRKTRLGKNGVIARWVEGGDCGNVWLDKIGKDKKLKRVLALWAYSDGKIHYMQRKNGKDIEIGKSKYKNLIKKNCKTITLKFYKVDNKAVKKVKKASWN